MLEGYFSKYVYTNVTPFSVQLQCVSMCIQHFSVTITSQGPLSFQLLQAHPELLTTPDIPDDNLPVKLRDSDIAQVCALI